MASSPEQLGASNASFGPDSNQIRLRSGFAGCCSKATPAVIEKKHLRCAFLEPRLLALEDDFGFDVRSDLKVDFKSCSEGVLQSARGFT